MMLNKRTIHRIFLPCIGAATAIGLTLSACEKQEVQPSKAPVAETTPKASSARCDCPSSWDCTDLDAGQSYRNINGYIPYYANQVGWTRFAWPIRKQRYANNNDCGFMGWFPDKDNRIYFSDSYFANPNNKGAISLRITSGGNTCGNNKLPVVDYFTANAGNPFGLAQGTPYVRVDIGEFCNTAVALVAP